MREVGSLIARSIDLARVKALALTLLLAGLTSLLFASSAGAGTIHQFEAGFKLAGPGETIPGPIAIDEEAELLYVLNLNQSAYQRFDLSGNPVKYPGRPGPNETQIVYFEEGAWVVGNTFTLTCPNSETTAPIEWNDEASELQGNTKAALEAKCGGTFSLEGGPNYLYVTFKGTFAETNVPRMTCATVTGSGTCQDLQ